MLIFFEAPCNVLNIFLIGIALCDFHWLPTTIRCDQLFHNALHLIRLPVVMNHHNTITLVAFMQNQRCLFLCERVTSEDTNSLYAVG